MKKIILLTWAALLLAACNNDELFDKEMYKNIVALLSSDYYNTFEEVIDLSATGEAATGYIVACTGGTHAPSREMAIELENDLTALDFYNRSLFDGDESCYAKLLSPDKYEMESYQIHILPGERTGRTRVKIHPEGLSPDTTYFIGLKAKEQEGIELNAKKQTVLYQILIRNAYATQGDDLYYSMTGTSNGIATAGNKKLFPLTHNSVRMTAGTETFESTEAAINETSLILEVDTDGHVSIKPYKTMEVKQIDNDPKFPNTFRVEESYGHTYNVFLLSYEYTLKGKTRKMQEELRLEVKK